MAEPRGTLHFISGRLASGKTTLARELAEKQKAVFICEDVWLSKLSDGISSFEDYLKWSRRCRSVMGPIVVDILKAGTSVVLDFAGNTTAERKWSVHYLKRPKQLMYCTTWTSPKTNAWPD